MRKVMDDFGRQALHAAVLGFVHPGSRAMARYEAPIPSDFANLIKSLEEIEKAP
jgi:23S rRNA pseudouridine1911/1915/1917 synthase